MTELRLDRVDMVIEQLKKIRPAQAVMSLWSEKFGVWEKDLYVEGACNTAGCIGGWGQILQQKEYFKLSVYEKRDYDRQNPYLPKGYNPVRTLQAWWNPDEYYQGSELNGAIYNLCHGHGDKESKVEYSAINLLDFDYLQADTRQAIMVRVVQAFRDSNGTKVIWSEIAEEYAEALAGASALRDGEV